jgi:hypothetical protein
MITTVKTALLCAVAAAAAAASYAACFGQFDDPQCLRVGDHYGQCTPPGCSQSTGLIATSIGQSYNDHVLPSGWWGGWRTRKPAGYQENCSVNSCKVYNNCTQSYNYSVNGWIGSCSCSFMIDVYIGDELGCQ